MGIKIPPSSTARPSKIYPNWDFWFKNIPSGNTAAHAHPMYDPKLRPRLYRMIQRLKAVLYPYLSGIRGGTFFRLALGIPVLIVPKQSSFVSMA
jgi:hypothetical protein